MTFYEQLITLSILILFYRVSDLEWNKLLFKITIRTIKIIVMFSFRVLFTPNISFPTNKLAVDVESVTQKRSRPCPLKLLKLSAFLALKI